MNKIKFLLSIFFIFFSISCSKETNKKTIIIEKNIEAQILKSYNEGLEELESGDALFAAKKFNEVETMFPQSKWAPKSTLMAAYAYYSQDMDIVGIIENFGRLNLSEGEKRAYEAPYPSGKYKSGAHVWPYLIPSQLKENEKYWEEVYEKWDKPFLVAFGSEERITIRMKDDFVNRIPNPTVITLEGIGHFVQEEAGPELAQIIHSFIKGQEIVSSLVKEN